MPWHVFPSGRRVWVNAVSGSSSSSVGRVLQTANVRRRSRKVKKRSQSWWNKRASDARTSWLQSLFRRLVRARNIRVNRFT